MVVQKCTEVYQWFFKTMATQMTVLDCLIHAAKKKKALQNAFHLGEVSVCV